MYTPTNDSDLRALFERWFNNKATPEEIDKLKQWYTEKDRQEELTGLLKDRWSVLEEEEQFTPVQLSELTERIFAASPPEPEEKTIPVPVWRRYSWVAAASVLLVLVAGAYWWLTSGNDNNAAIVHVDKQKQTDKASGQEGAILTLADGTQMILDSLGNGVIANQNGVQLLLKDGLLAYHTDGQSGNELMYNTVSTPNGRQFQLMLPDGSKIWLNAASSVTYPTAFKGNLREVKITGEVYFEVKQEADNPFIVQIANGSQIQVLGTSFNVNAYNDEAAIYTTLLSGSVQIKNNGTAPVVLKPGYQSRFVRKTGALEVRRANEEAVMAWKQGYFHFDEADIRTIMRQIERWYDVDVTFAQVPAKTFSGVIPRNVNVSQVFAILEATGNVHFKIEGNNVIVNK